MALTAQLKKTGIKANSFEENEVASLLNVANIVALLLDSSNKALVLSIPLKNNYQDKEDENFPWLEPDIAPKNIPYMDSFGDFLSRVIHDNPWAELHVILDKADLEKISWLRNSPNIVLHVAGSGDTWQRQVEAAFKNRNIVMQ